MKVCRGLARHAAKMEHGSYMDIQLYNTLTRRKETFQPADPQRVTMYVCGPTVYNYAHIGNARPAVVFDVLARLLRTRYGLVYVRNITDVDDKINAAAAAAREDIGVLTRRYTEAFHEDMRALGVLAPDVEPRVTEHLQPIVAMIERLLAAGHAYEAQGHVLFSVASFPEYGALSGRNREQMLDGARVEVAPYKRDPGDFVLWKPSAPDTVGWDSPWGRGRPGWHIECSAMCATHLGETLDIHGGGQDLIFPHHENEIAQSTCAHGGQLFARYWMHNGFVNVDAEKMSKSLNNVLLVRDLLGQAPGEAVRVALLTGHYRKPLDWTDRLLEDSRCKLDRLYGALREALPEDGDFSVPAAAEDAPAAVQRALADDLNTPEALAELFNLARRIHTSSDSQQRFELGAQLRAGGVLLGLLQQDPQAWFAGVPAGCDLTEEDIQERVHARQEARATRDFAAADRIRDELFERGIVIEDRPEGTRWRRVG